MCSVRKIAVCFVFLSIVVGVLVFYSGLAPGGAPSGSTGGASVAAPGGVPSRSVGAGPGGAPTGSSGGATPTAPGGPTVLLAPTGSGGTPAGAPIATPAVAPTGTSPASPGGAPTTGSAPAEAPKDALADAAKAAPLKTDLEVKGTVTEVTLYRGQALVTREVPVESAKGGELVIAVTPLPDQVVAGSLYAEGTEATQVRAVRYWTKAVAESQNPEIRDYDKAIEDLNENIQTIRKTQELLNKRSAYLDQLESGFIQPAIKTDLAKGVLDAKNVETISLFDFAQREAITKEMITLEKKYKDLNMELATKESNRAKLTKTTTRMERQALLFVEKPKPGKDTVRLNYLVSRCGWSPTYTFRASKDRKEVAYEYNALIQQTSGEDWGRVKLTLSTASPIVAATGPGLGPFNINVSRGAPTPTIQNVQKDISAQLKSILSRQEAALQQTQSASSMKEQIDRSFMANSAANEIQVLELNSKIDAWFTLQPSDLNVGEGTSVSYSLAPAVTLDSRSDQQIVQVSQGKLKSKFYYIATPVLTTFGYREAELTNTAPEDFLAGPMMVYLDGRFVGRGEIPTVATNQTFVVGFGVDPQVRTGRALLDREEKAQGANRQLNMKYQLTVENFKDEPVTLRLFDRMPYYATETDIRIKLGEIKDKLSEDPIYRMREFPKNILRWDIEVPTKTTGQNAKMIDYNFTVEFAGNANLTTVSTGTPAENQQIQQDFEQLQRARQGGANQAPAGAPSGGGGFGGGAAGGRGGAASGAGGAPAARGSGGGSAPPSGG
jgi:uncharacterized protein (TIGR02231 family)